MFFFHQDKNMSCEKSIAFGIYNLHNFGACFSDGLKPTSEAKLSTGTGPSFTKHFVGTQNGEGICSDTFCCKLVQLAGWI